MRWLPIKETEQVKLLRYCICPLYFQVPSLTINQDGYVLGHLIAKAVRSNTPIYKLTEVYDAIRRPFANFVHAASKTHGLLYEFNAPGFEDVEEGQEVGLGRLKELGELIIGDWEYAWLSTAEEDLQRGLAML